jgi:urease gamma subunit
MHLSPRELDHLRLAQAGQLAQRRLARGCQLNHPEAVALISSQMMEMIRDGKSVAELMVLGQQLLGRRQVLPGVASMISNVQIEATFQDGTKLLSIHSPISSRDGDLSLALHGSFLPVPDLSIFGDLQEEEEPPGAMFYADSDGIELNAGRNLIEIGVTNSGDRPIQASVRAAPSCCYSLRADSARGLSLARRFLFLDTEVLSKRSAFQTWFNFGGAWRCARQWWSRSWAGRRAGRAGYLVRLKAPLLCWSNAR